MKETETRKLRQVGVLSDTKCVKLIRGIALACDNRQCVTAANSYTLLVF